MTESEVRRIDGEPTKEFFIYMLTRDISLIQAIADLLDNCVDGAKRLMPDSDYSKLWIRVEANEDYFKISDNCGGISVEIAEKYAFRFGRPKEMRNTEHSIGQFGVGMKRAFFKIGEVFEIDSVTDDSRFRVVQNVSEWAAKKDDWDFAFNMVEEGKKQRKSLDRGTAITIKKLFKSVATDFCLNGFKDRLNRALTSAHQDAIGKGLNITLNGEPLHSSAVELLTSDELLPSKKTLSFGKGHDEVRVILHCGIANSSPTEAGWYVYCNGRLVLGADRDRITGWGDGIGTYHNEYARFRGYVFFDADNSSLLPWTTTKSSVNQESPYYQATRNEMLIMMRPIISFLSKVAKEKKNVDEGEPTPLETKIKESQAKPLSVETQDVLFKAPLRSIEPKPAEKNNRISYSRPSVQVNKVKKVLGVKTLKEVGEKTFDYYVNMECE